MSIPSHPTVLWVRMDTLGESQRCPFHPISSTVLWVRMDTLGESQRCPFHPIPHYCGLEWTHWGNPNDVHSIASHCTMKAMDTLGESQRMSIPFHPIPLYCELEWTHCGNPKLSHAQYPKSQVSIPSHCTMRSNGNTRESQAVPCTIPQGGHG